jgi:hypothetical protein
MSAKSRKSALRLKGRKDLPTDLVLADLVVQGEGQAFLGTVDGNLKPSRITLALLLLLRLSTEAGVAFLFREISGCSSSKSLKAESQSPANQIPLACSG